MDTAQIVAIAGLCLSAAGYVIAFRWRPRGRPADAGIVTQADLDPAL